MKTYIIGHQKPDTDAVVAPLALAYLYKKADCFGYSDPIPAITDPLNPETKYLFDKFKVKTSLLITAKDIGPKDNVVLADHNEASQRLEGLKESQIVEIIDHHKINLDLTQPIFLTFKTWGSTTTIVYYLMKQQDVKPDKSLAALMLAAILSDTVGFKSATSTDKDKECGQELAAIAEIDDIDGFTLELFKAKSDTSKLSDEEIVKNDYKVYDFGPKKVYISQLETVEQKSLLGKKKQLLLAMKKVKQEMKVDLLFVLITDVLQVNTKILILDDQEKIVVEKAFAQTAIESILDIGPKMSRKKEIAPAIEAVVKNKI